LIVDLLTKLAHQDRMVKRSVVAFDIAAKDKAVGRQGRRDRAHGGLCPASPSQMVAMFSLHNAKFITTGVPHSNHFLVGSILYHQGSS